MMNSRSRGESIPARRTRTVRQQLIGGLRGIPVSVGTLSVELGLPEKQVIEHLESIRKQVKLRITPARCLKCGFVFRNRRRPGKPGKCPSCRSTHIQEPLYSIPDP